MKKIGLLMILMVLSVFSLAEDILTLKDGKSFEGEVTKIKNCHVYFQTEIGTFIIPAYDISAIQLENPSKRVLKKYTLMSDTTNADKCMFGQQDAEMFHGKNFGHFVLGFLFGPFALIGTALANPTPDKGQRTYMMSEHKDLFSDPSYLLCYKKKARGKLLGREAAGWGTWLLLVLLVAVT
jgi:hypothetical protein